VQGLRVAKRNSAGVTFDKVKAIALALPEVAESTSYGTPALKVRGKLVLRLREDHETLVIRTSWENRERLMIIDPEVYFLTDHYRAYPWVLAKLSNIAEEALPALIESAWREAAPKALLKRRNAV
jgi:hypothetical protein